MVIVAGHLMVEATGRAAAYLAGCTEVVVAARSSEGCLDFSIGCDLLDPRRVNVCEKWESHEAIAAFAVIDGMRDRGLVGDDGWLSALGRTVKQRVEALPDDLAAKPYERL